ncbi:MAG: LCP family protein [Anaerolineae bacterium]|nr:LCP family protein [Anaerolineae bacterium]MDW8100817.1 LCP family protein [Anaerolineae bacterium]
MNDRPHLQELDTEPSPWPLQEPTPIWPGLLLGFLLASFLLAFSYSSYLLYQWARATIASAPSAMSSTTTAIAGGVLPGASGAMLTPPPAPGAIPTIPAWEPGRKERVNILLMGVDQRPGERGPSRTDTLIVVTINPATGRVGMLSIPRDLWVRIPGYEMFGKINTAYVVGEQHGYPGGGAALAKQTVSELIGYPVHYYVKVNFDGFRRLIDLIGGIDIYVPRDINDPTFPDDNYGYDPLFIPAGQHHMNGDLALKYARTRHGDDDYGRARRQQQVLLATKEQIMRADMLPSLILRLPQLMQTFADNVETDIPLDRMVTLANLARHLDLDHIEQLVIDRTLGEERNDPDIGYVLIPNRDAIRPLMDEMFGDLPLTEVSEETAHLTETSTSQVQNELAIEQARIAVLDGADNPLMAQRVADWLKFQGFQIVEVGKAERSTYSHALIRVFVRKPHTLTRLQTLLGQVEVQDMSGTIATPSRDMEIVIGRDFSLAENTPQQ